MTVEKDEPYSTINAKKYWRKLTRFSELCRLILVLTRYLKKLNFNWGANWVLEGKLPTPPTAP
jgi:hypothetical protein